MTVFKMAAPAPLEPEVATLGFRQAFVHCSQQ